MKIKTTYWFIGRINSVVGGAVWCIDKFIVNKHLVRNPKVDLVGSNFNLKFEEYIISKLLFLFHFQVIKGVCMLILSYFNNKVQI